jgi:UDP-glucose 4-epimerase
MMALLGHIDDFSVMGGDFDTPDGTAIRDYIHVADLADAHVLALGALLEGDGGETYNLGSAQGSSVRDVLRSIEAATGRRLSPVSGARRPGDPARLVADSNLARRRLGFRTTRSSMQQITASAWKWHRQAHPQRDHAALVGRELAQA